MKKKVVGLGEVLWDHLPERTCLGGAPANFAYITTLMGDQVEPRREFIEKNALSVINLDV